LGYFTSPNGTKITGSDGSKGCIKNGDNLEPPNVPVATSTVLVSEKSKMDKVSVLSDKIISGATLSKNKNKKKVVLSN